MLNTTDNRNLTLVESSALSLLRGFVCGYIVRGETVTLIQRSFNDPHSVVRIELSRLGFHSTDRYRRKIAAILAFRNEN